MLKKLFHRHKFIYLDTLFGKFRPHKNGIGEHAEMRRYYSCKCGEFFIYGVTGKESEYGLQEIRGQIPMDEVINNNLLDWLIRNFPPN